MATLEKIRSKSVLLFTIFIVALLAFILGDFLTSGRTFFGPGDTVASANGAKVSFNDYQKRVNELSEAQKGSRQAVDNDVLGQQAIEQLLVEALLEKEYDRLGITVTDKQISNIMLGEKTAPSIFQGIMQQFGQGAALLYSKGVVDSRTYYDAMKNPAKYGLQAEEGRVMTDVWTNTEKTLDQQIRSMAYGSLVQGLFTANELDAKAIYNDRNTSRHFTYVRKDLSAIADKDVKLTDADYKKVYDERKGMFKLEEETRAVSYIVVPIVPSDADYAKGQSQVETVLAALSNSEGTEALNQYPDFVAQTGKYTRASLERNPQLRSLTAADTTGAGLTAGSVRLASAVSGNYVIAKINSVTTGVDKVKFSAFGATAADMDSIRVKLNTADFDSIASANGGQTGIQTSLVNPSLQLTEAQTLALTSNPVGQIFYTTDTIQGQNKDGKPMQQVVSTAFLITERDAPVAVYDIAAITYSVVPSTETVTDLNTRFHAFVANNATAETFSKNAEKSGYQCGSALVSPSAPNVANCPGSRGAVKWAMENGKGKVSPVFTESGTADYLLAVAVDDIYDGEYIPVDSKFVREYLEPQAMANVKADKLIKKYAGKAKDIAGYSSLMGTPVAQADAVFGDDMVAGVGYAENNLQGAVAASAKGKLTGPFQGNNAIFVVVVDSEKSEGRPYKYDESAITFMQRYVAPMLNNRLQLLLGDGKIKNNILQFTQEEVN